MHFTPYTKPIKSCAKGFLEKNAQTSNTIREISAIDVSRSEVLCSQTYSTQTAESAFSQFQFLLFVLCIVYVHSIEPIVVV